MKIILGSSSPSRRRLMAEVTDSFEVMSPDIDEKAIRSHDHEQLPLLLAKAKAAALLTRIKEPAIVVTCDQVCICNGQLREKPRDAEEAKDFIMSYNEYPATILGAMVVINTKSGRQASEQWSSEAVYRHIPEAVIDQLIVEGEVLKAAGAVRLESPLLAPYLVELRGEADAFMGLSVAITKRLIKSVEED